MLWSVLGSGVHLVPKLTSLYQNIISASMPLRYRRVDMNFLDKKRIRRVKSKRRN